jgi:hypothetical protein
MKRMRQINKRRLLEYLIYWEIKEIQYQFSFEYQFSFDSEENWLDEGFKIDLLEDLNEVADILKSLSYTADVESVRIRYKNRYRSTYWKNLVVEDLVSEEDLSNKFNYEW